MSCWQSETESLLERTSFVFNRNIFSDVSFHIGPDAAIFYAHKLLLSLSSPIFADMFHGNSSTTCNPVEIPDVTTKAFENVLKYIYTDSFKIEGIQEAHEVYFAAKKFKMNHLQTKCQEFISGTEISPETFCKMYETAIKLQMNHVLKMCQYTIENETKAVFQSEQFTLAKLSTLKAIVENDNLSIDNELEVIQAVLRWGNAECSRNGISLDDKNIRECIKPLMKDLRFLTLSLEEFLQFVDENHILTASEACVITSKLCRPHVELPLPPTLCPNHTKRKAEAENIVDKGSGLSVKDVHKNPPKPTSDAILKLRKSSSADFPKHFLEAEIKAMSVLNISSKSNENHMLGASNTMNPDQSNETQMKAMSLLNISSELVNQRKSQNCKKETSNTMNSVNNYSPMNNVKNKMHSSHELSYEEKVSAVKASVFNNGLLPSKALDRSTNLFTSVQPDTSHISGASNTINTVYDSSLVNSVKYKTPDELLFEEAIKKAEASPAINVIDLIPPKVRANLKFVFPKAKKQESNHISGVSNSSMVYNFSANDESIINDAGHNNYSSPELSFEEKIKEARVSPTFNLGLSAAKALGRSVSSITSNQPEVEIKKELEDGTISSESSSDSEDKSDCEDTESPDEPFRSCEFKFDTDTTKPSFNGFRINDIISNISIDMLTGGIKIAGIVLLVKKNVSSQDEIIPVVVKAKNCLDSYEELHNTIFSEELISVMFNKPLVVPAGTNANIKVTIESLQLQRCCICNILKFTLRDRNGISFKVVLSGNEKYDVNKIPFIVSRLLFTPNN